MVQILDDDQLESLQCTKCRKYLSMLPVKDHPNHDVTCVEKTCVGSTFDCPKCRDGTARTVLDLMWHYRQRHPASYLKKNCFEVNPPFDDDAMLYVRDDVVFFIVTRRESDATRLSAVTLTEVEATQAFMVLRSGAGHMKTERRRCGRLGALDDGFVIDAVEPFEVIFDLEVSSKGARRPYGASVPSTSNNVAPQKSTIIVPVTKPAIARHGRPSLPVRLMEDFEKYTGFKLDSGGMAVISRNGRRVDLACSNCRQLIGLPIYECRKSKHRICRGCSAWCGICECEVNPLNSEDPFLGLSVGLQFHCKWKCGGYFGSKLHHHESICALRVKTCPECPIKVHLNYMKSHLFYEHRKHFVEQYDTGIAHVINRKNGEVYFLLSDKWCCMNWHYRDYNIYNFKFRSLEPNTELGTINDCLINKWECSYDNDDRRYVTIDSITKVYLKFKYGRSYLPA